MTSCENQQKVSHIHVHTVCLPGQAFSVKMPGYWPFFKFIFIHLFSFFFSHSEVEAPAHAPKKERGSWTRPISNLDPCAYAVWARKSSGVEIAPISSHLDRKSLIYHMVKNRTLYCAGYYCEQWLAITEKFSLNDTALRHDLVSFRSASLV